MVNTGLNQKGFDMRTKTLAAILACAVIANAVPRAEAESLDDVKKKLHDKVSSYKSLSYKMKTTNDTPQMKSTIDMTCEYMRKGDEVLGRTEQDAKTTTNMGGKEQKMDTKTLMIYDGKFNYIYSEMMGQKSAIKQKVASKDQTTPFDPMLSFKLSEQSFKLKLLPDETVNGKPAYAIEMTPKDDAMREYVGRTVTYYDKSNGIFLKSVSYDAKTSKPSGTTIVTDVKIDPSISPDRFVFKTPAGVELQDMTKMGE